MKKYLIAFVVFILLALGCIYIFIPQKLTISAVCTIATPADAVYRCVNNETSLRKWMNNSNDSFYKSCRIDASVLNEAVIFIRNGKDSAKTTMNLLSLNKDSTLVQWQCALTSGNDPFTKIYRYNVAVHLKKNMDSMLQQLKLFASNNENIYGINISESPAKDPLLISTKTMLQHYPATADIYSLIDKLKTYAAHAQVQVTGYPMYNATSITDDSTRLMVALPVNNLPQNSSTIESIRMVKGRFMTTTVTGGDGTVKNALTQLQNYFADYNKTAMAIPFAYIITNRMEEPDTLQWITKIYAPVY